MAQIALSQAASTLTAHGTLSQTVASQLSQGDRSIRVADVRRGFEDPVMACFVIDASPSMKPFRDAVIEAQHEMIEILRGSAKCRKNALYVAQWLFSNDATLLNPFQLLNSTGSDSVARLDTSSYRPEDGNGTALYITVFQVLQDMAANIAYALNNNIRSTFTIGLITDGEDNKGKVPPSDIKAIVQELTQQGHLTSSVLFGIENPGLSRARVVEIQETLGFSDAVFVGQNAADIRRAFVLASQSAIKGGIL